MKRFRYRLERVLEYRQDEKDERKRELAEKNRSLHEREERLSGIEQAQQTSAPPEGGVLTMAELSHLKEYHASLQKALIEQRVLVLDAAEAVDEARKAFVEKSVEVKTLDELKDRKKEEWKDEKRREEKKELDELVVQRHRLTKPGK
jgi:flagellar FliJ protein